MTYFEAVVRAMRTGDDAALSELWRQCASTEGTHIAAGIWTLAKRKVRELAETAVPVQGMLW